MHEPSYWEIPSTDTAATARFFEKLFGWKMTPSVEDYWMFEVEGGMSGGIQPVAEAPGHGVMVYIRVEDIPAVLSQVAELGGEVLKTKTEIGNDWGYWAEFKTPGGCRSVALWSKE